MKRLLIVAAVVAAVAAGWTWDDRALASSSSSTLDRVGTLIAMRPAEVRCVDQDADPQLSNAWGYTYLPWNFAVVDAMLCDAIGDELGFPVVHLAAPPPPTVSGAHSFGRLPRDRGYAPEFGDEWKTANAVLVLTHEMFHVRRWALRGSESAVECRAIRHSRAVAQLLGFSEDRARELLAWQLAFHWRIGVLAPEYRSEDCSVPWPY